jgi:uncharacterized membrane protein YuzA (DUF378 family)
MWVRVTGVIMIVLGLLLWSGNVERLVQLHMLIGITLVLALWGLAVIGAMARVSRGLVVVALVWGLIVPVLGFTQTRLLSGSAHWLIQILHLLVGLGAISLAMTLGRQIKTKRPGREIGLALKIDREHV